MLAVRWLRQKKLKIFDVSDVFGRFGRFRSFFNLFRSFLERLGSFWTVLDRFGPFLAAVKKVPTTPELDYLSN